MDVQTLWAAARSVGLASGLLVHASDPDYGVLAPRPVGEAQFQYWMFQAQTVPIEQVFAALLR